MAKIIRDGGIVDDPWRLLTADVAKINPDLPHTGEAREKLILPLSVWRAWTSDFECCHGGAGVWIEADQSLEDMADVITQVPVIAVHFSSFVNGRGFSTGTLLRELYHFSGELRAFGELILDQVPYLRRCGFNAISLSTEKQLESALQLLLDSGLTYQGSVFSPRTPFKLRYDAASGPAPEAGKRTLLAAVDAWDGENDR